MAKDADDSGLQKQAEVSPEQALRLLYGDGKPFILVYHAVIIAAMADELADLVMLFAGGKPVPAKIPPIPAVTDWLPMYKNHRQMIDGFMDNDALVPDEECDLSLSQLSRHFRAFIKFSPKRRERLIRRYSDADELRQIVLLFSGIKLPLSVEVVSGILQAQEEETEKGLDAVGERISSLEWQFFLRVWIPVLILHHCYPPQLFHKARCGDIDAMDDLLRIDKSVIHDRLIGEHWHRVMHGGKSGPRQRLLKAINSRPRGKLTQTKIRS